MNHSDQQINNQSIPNIQMGESVFCLKTDPLQTFDEPYRLNLGCGKKRMIGYIGVDVAKSDATDIVSDITNLAILPSNYISEILSVHVCEHFFRHELPNVLTEWRRVLKPGGKFVVELPCWDKVKVLIAHGAPENMTRWALYGEPRTHIDGYPALHKWCWSISEFHGLLEHVGFHSIKSETPLFHQPMRDMRFVAWK